MRNKEKIKLIFPPYFIYGKHIVISPTHLKRDWYKCICPNFSLPIFKNMLF